MNRFFAIGRLTKDPEKRTTQNGTSVCTFTLAVDRRFKNANGEREADFFPVVCWRQTADFVAEYLSKGKLAGVIGEMQTRSYDDKNGVKRYVTECVAEDVKILSPKSEGAAQTQEPEMTPVSADEDLPF
nr:MAG TPA: Single strand binding protein [Caudoviricetes sp.]DAM92514.1 MAG TPA: Single strand binding protein [Caudoviricetes sp.]